MIDLDDEDAFLNRVLPQALAKQQAEGIVVGGDNLDENSGWKVVRRPIVEPAPEIIPYEKPPLTKRLGVVDLETDPFAVRRKPEPFAAGLALDDGRYFSFWGMTCVDEFFEKLLDIADELEEQGEELCIYAHNGGNFDFHYFMDYLPNDAKPFLINKRLVKIDFAGIEFRDSYSIMPVALKKLSTADHKKLEIEFWKMEAICREEWKDEILTYLEADCRTLLAVVKRYIDTFGWRLTIASTAYPLLRSMHAIADMNGESDAKIRPFYSGGRVQCFKTGIMRGNFIMVDANSMYPAAMANFEHPVSAIPFRCQSWEDSDFAIIEAENNGCLGSLISGGFDFTHKRGTFFASRHEIQAGIDTGTLRVKKTRQAYKFMHRAKLDTFVHHFYDQRNAYREEGDIAMVEFMKLVMNSSYGKAAQHTGHYRTFLVNPSIVPYPHFRPGREEWVEMEVDGVPKKVCTLSPRGWRLDFNSPACIVYSRPKFGAGDSFLNVALAASITGASRSVLWRAICASTNPIYCDTDSIICEGFNGDIDAKRLGAWKVEASGEAVFVAGKKMYAFLSTTRPSDFNATKHEYIEIEGQGYYLLKKAHKGVQLTGAQILAVCRGETIEAENENPTFSLGGKVAFVKRRVKMTAGDPVQMELDLAAA